MKKTYRTIVSIILMLVLLVSLSSCIGNVTPFGYTTFKTKDNQVAYYDSSMYGTHIYIFENESMMPNGNDEKYIDNGALYRLDCESSSIITIGFKRILGVEVLDSTRATLVEMDKWYYIEVSIQKDSSVYSSNKSIYLNGVKLEKNNKNDLISDGEYVIIYHFEDCGLMRSNKNGKIDSSIINVIEYK